MSSDEKVSASAAALHPDETAIGEAVKPADFVGAVSSASTDEVALPLYAEQVVVARHKLERKVQVSLHTVTRDHPVDELLTHERVEIERVPIGREIDAVPADRQEGDTTIISVVEEVVVVRRQLVLKEEVRMRRVRVTEHHRETVSLREQEATVERDEPVAIPAADNPATLEDFAS